jgi:hypothetical protein
LLHKRLRKHGNWEKKDLAVGSDHPHMCSMQCARIGLDGNSSFLRRSPSNIR